MDKVEMVGYESLVNGIKEMIHKKQYHVLKAINADGRGGVSVREDHVVSGDYGKIECSSILCKVKSLWKK